MPSSLDTSATTRPTTQKQKSRRPMFLKPRNSRKFRCLSGVDRIRYDVYAGVKGCTLAKNVTGC